jgi:hypothetical protein
VRQAGLRVVVVPDTWAYHPMPATPGELWESCWEKGRTSAMVQRRFPDLVLELDAGFRKDFPARRGFPYRALRFAAMFVRGMFTGQFILASARTCYALGYLSGRLEDRGASCRT